MQIQSDLMLGVNTRVETKFSEYYLFKGGNYLSKLKEQAIGIF